MYPDHRMSPVLSVLVAQGSMRPFTDFTAQGQDEESLAEVIWTRLILGTRGERGWN